MHPAHKYLSFIKLERQTKRNKNAYKKILFIFIILLLLLVFIQIIYY